MEFDDDCERKVKLLKWKEGDIHGEMEDGAYVFLGF